MSLSDFIGNLGVALRALAGQQKERRYSDATGSQDHEVPMSPDPLATSTSSSTHVVMGADGDAQYPGWHDRSVAEWQDAAYKDLLAEMYAGDIRLDLKVAAEAIRDAGIRSPRILEVGCGSGYYSEVLEFLCDGGVQYTGLDYSKAMIDLAISKYPKVSFLVGDATKMDLPDDSFDVVFNGAALMHMPNYVEAIAESRRIAKAWCIFHTVPLVSGKSTTTLTKKAYGGDVVEVVFNKRAFERLLAQGGLTTFRIYENIPHTYLDGAMGEPVTAFTYLCKVEEAK